MIKLYYEYIDKIRRGLGCDLDPELVSLLVELLIRNKQHEKAYILRLMMRNAWIFEE